MANIHHVTCPGCGLCINECTVQWDCISRTEDGVCIDLDRCIRCGHCVAICPHDRMDNPLSPKQERLGPALPAEEAERFLRRARSVRFYQDRPVPQELLERLVNIGRYAQTPENTQGIGYIVVSGKEKLAAITQWYRELAKTVPEDFPGYKEIRNTVYMQDTYGHDALFYDAQHLIVAISDRELGTWQANAQFALTFIALLAPSLGLGTCWIGLLEFVACHEPYMAEFGKLIGLPEGKRVCGCMMAGYPRITWQRLVERDPLEVYWR